jgi:hypothetical protein
MFSYVMLLYSSHNTSSNVLTSVVSALCFNVYAANIAYRKSEYSEVI